MKISNYFLIMLTSLTLWGCPEDPEPPPADNGGEVAGEPAGTFTEDMRPGGETIEMDMELDLGPMEASPCTADEECFAGRICVDDACQDAECQEDSDCPADQPRCFGVEGEEPGQRRGRCGDCLSDDDCYGRSTCALFSAASDDDNPAGGLCELDGNCDGSLECAPRSSFVIRGPLSEVCLDRRTSERDPICAEAFNCQGDDTCPEGLTCLNSGQCATLTNDEVCELNTQCGFGEVCREDGLCGPCSSNSECGDAQACNAGRCEEIPGACTDDVQCLGARRCVLNECAPPECNEDNFGEHASFETATMIDGDRAYRSMVSCGDDWYSFVLAPSMSALITVRQRDRGANLGIVAFDEEERELGRSVGPAPVEAVRLRESAAPRTLYIRVFQEGPQSAAEYDLEISYVPTNAGVCLDDPFELNGGDDDENNARIIRYDRNDNFPPQVRGQVCAGDTDYLCFEMRNGELLTIEGEVDLGDALVVGTLFDPQGGEIAEGRWANDQNPVNVEQTVEQSGRYCLVISSEVEGSRREGQGRYTLKLNGVSPELAELCETKTPLAITDRRGGELGELSGESVLRASCAPESDGPEAIYTVNVTEPSLLVARVAGVPAGTLGDPVISLREQCDRETSEIACSARGYDSSNPYVIPPNPAVLRAPLNPPVDPVTGQGIGQYTLILDGVSVGEQPNYQVDVELRPLAPPPINEDCARVTALEFSDGVSVVESSLDQASADLVTCGDNGPDVTFEFTLAEASEVTIQVSSKPAVFPVIVSLSDQCGGPAIACGFGVNEVLDAGTYHLTVAGAEPMSRGLVELQVSATPLPVATDNETCDNAAELTGPSGSISGDTRGAENDYDLGANNLCTRDNTSAGDLVYSYTATAGETVVFSATPEVGWDLSLYIVDRCDGDLTQACLAGQDGALTETITFTPQSSGVVYVVIDGANGESGPFELTWGPAE